MKLPIPDAAIAQHVAILGKTGAGKSPALRLIVEYLLRQGKRVCIIDPKGDWWGLKLSGERAATRSEAGSVVPCPNSEPRASSSGRILIEWT